MENSKPLTLDVAHLCGRDEAESSAECGCSRAVGLVSHLTSYHAICSGEAG